jgi:THO complex subunit 7
MAVSEDDIIKCKLLIEGDGGNDDRRISSFLRMFVKWAQSTETEEESDATYHKMLSLLAQCELTMLKSLQVHDMNIGEQENYKNLSQQIEQQIKDACEQITECKNELQQARFIRKNRQEYDALAKVIQQHPDRQETIRQLAALDKELEAQRETKAQLKKKLELRQKQFHVLIVAIHGLQRILEDDELTGEGRTMDES